MDVMWGIVSTLVYIVAVFIAVEFCCGRIKKYSKRDEEDEASGRRKSAPALQADAAREGGATAADTTTEVRQTCIYHKSSIIG
ncbi:Hypp1697 [Branchiostoma lanceolatum]|uniref:Hypp1697 protein n=1 Tax=Branchiostoma lanceolatum TaxID=7740 RepID=A0A8J9ZJQ4_BRALA|nr:Hypp1697 [Branchiostoma lanceolatum]